MHVCACVWACAFVRVHVCVCVHARVCAWIKVFTEESCVEPFLEINKVISVVFYLESLPNLKADVVKLLILFSVMGPKQKYVKITKYVMVLDLFICIELNSILFLE